MNIELPALPSTAAALPPPSAPGQAPAPPDLFALCLGMAPAPTSGTPPAGLEIPEPAAAEEAGEISASATDSLLALLSLLEPAAAPAAEIATPAETPAATILALAMPVPVLNLLPVANAPAAGTPPPRSKAGAPAATVAVAEPLPAPAPSAGSGTESILPAMPTTAAEAFAPFIATAPPPENSAPTVSAAMQAPATSLAAITSAARPETAPTLGMAEGPAASFAERFGEQVVWQVGQGLQEARIQLHPQELGAVDIQLSLDGEQASFIFTVEQPQARAAVQSALLQLGALLSGQGLQLADAQVQSQQRGSQPQVTPQARDTRDAVDEPAAAPLRRRIGLIDHYA